MKSLTLFVIIVSLFVLHQPAVAISSADTIRLTTPMIPAAAAKADSARTDTIPKVWKAASAISVDLSEVSYNSSWTLGGENALSYRATFGGTFTRDVPASNFQTTYKFVFGQSRLQESGLRKTDDVIDIGSVYLLKLGGDVSPYASESFKTQFTTSYNYDAVGLATATSTFLDPGYLTLALGASWQALPQLKTRLGAGVRAVFTTNYNSFSDDPSTPEVEKTKVDEGLEWVTEINWAIVDNLIFTSKTSVFAPIRNFGRMVVDSDNSLGMIASKYIKFSLTGRLISDPDVNVHVQIKQGIAIGFTYVLL
ncbi:MAG: DUF3078 domain-containing protein [Candidatus Kapaibacterium sp.]|jgi:hypothetical protein